jgi:hypothetical protein
VLYFAEVLIQIIHPDCEFAAFVQGDVHIYKISKKEEESNANEQRKMNNEQSKTGFLGRCIFTLFIVL